jgi:hypothetical protein
MLPAATAMVRVGPQRNNNKKYSKDRILLNDAVKCYTQQQLCFLPPQANKFLTASAPFICLYTHERLKCVNIFGTTRNLEQ